MIFASSTNQKEMFYLSRRPFIALQSLWTMWTSQRVFCFCSSFIIVVLGLFRVAYTNAFLFHMCIILKEKFEWVSQCQVDQCYLQHLPRPHHHQQHQHRRKRIMSILMFFPLISNLFDKECHRLWKVQHQQMEKNHHQDIYLVRLNYYSEIFKRHRWRFLASLSVSPSPRRAASNLNIPFIQTSVDLTRYNELAWLIPRQSSLSVSLHEQNTRR